MRKVFYICAPLFYPVSPHYIVNCGPARHSGPQRMDFSGHYQFGHLEIPDLATCIINNYRAARNIISVFRRLVWLHLIIHFMKTINVL